MDWLRRLLIGRATDNAHVICNKENIMEVKYWLEREWVQEEFDNSKQADCIASRNGERKGGNRI